MKKTLFIIGLCAVLLLMPTFVALPTTNKTYQQLLMSDGTFVGGFGRGHWGNGKFNIDSVYAYMNGVYTSTVFLKISGEMTKGYGKIGEINAYIIADKFIFGHTTNNNGQQSTIFGILKENENNQIVCRIFFSSMHSTYMWCLLIPNK
jgi:hypothetical protein